MPMLTPPAASASIRGATAPATIAPEARRICSAGDERGAAFVSAVLVTSDLVALPGNALAARERPFLIGRQRMRLPVAAKIALQSAGITGGSAARRARSADCPSCGMHLHLGASVMRSSG